MNATAAHSPSAALLPIGRRVLAWLAAVLSVIVLTLAITLGLHDYSGDGPSSRPLVDTSSATSATSATSAPSASA